MCGSRPAALHHPRLAVLRQPLHVLGPLLHRHLGKPAQAASTVEAGGVPQHIALAVSAPKDYPGLVGHAAPTAVALRPRSLLALQSEATCTKHGLAATQPGEEARPRKLEGEGLRRALPICRVHGDGQAGPVDAICSPHHVLLRRRLLDNDEVVLQRRQRGEQRPLVRVAVLREVSRAPHLVLLNGARRVLRLRDAPLELVLPAPAPLLEALRHAGCCRYVGLLRAGHLRPPLELLLCRMHAEQRLGACLASLGVKPLELVRVQQQNQALPSLGDLILVRLTSREAEQLVGLLGAPDPVDLSARVELRRRGLRRRHGRRRGRLGLRRSGRRRRWLRHLARLAARHGMQR
mmetsp:Transcript_25139/g.63755  ORF Transcript_25139/g.63755 Transcript_25139/m.63755 type:complete len:349 (+) Transcript_25139:342-1388(+)